MAKLKKFTLSHDAKKGDWVLKENGASRAAARFATKAEATAAGVLESKIPGSRGSVRIQKQDGKYQEERTYPRSADPRRSKG